MSTIRSRRGAARLMSAALFAFVLSPAAQAEVVISQVYGGGGNSGAYYTHDFVELFNDGNDAISVDGWSVQYASATGTSWQATALTGTLQPGQYLLVQQAKGSGGSAPLPTADVVGGIAMAGSSGKVALVAGSSRLSGSCPLDAVIDLVGFGGANCALGTRTPNLSNSTAAIRNDGGCANTRNNAADFTVAAPTPRNSASNLAPCGGSSLPGLTIADASTAEGNDGLVTLSFTITLSAPNTDTVQFDVATVDGTARAGSDYLAAAATLSLAAGETTAMFDVEVIGDTDVESDETFTVELTNIVGAIADRARATGTIENDDQAPLLPISAVQGAGIGSSPWLGKKVQVEGVITALRVNGYLVQSAAGEDDGDDTTAEGLFVFVGSAGLPAEAQVGRRVRVQGQVTEFARTPHGYPLTQLGWAALTVLADSQPLPAAIALSQDDLSPTAPISRLGRYNGMRVTLPAARVVNASNRFGDFYVTLADTARPFREPGIAVLDAVPLPAELDAPRFDMNPERLRVESTGLLGALPLSVDNGATVSGLAGIMYYDRGDFTLLRDADAVVQIDGGLLPVAAPAADANTISVAGFNIENLSGGANTSIERLRKLSAVFCTMLQTPDIVGVTEIGNLETLQRVAAAINDNEFGDCPDSPQYSAHLLSQQGSQRLGFLVSGREVRPGTPRVEVLEIAEEAANDPFLAPDGTPSSAPLFDRAPLRLTAIVHDDSGEQFPLTVIANHLLSMLDVNSLTPRNDSWINAGNRSRAKRMAQAVRLGEIVQARQDADPAERILLLGDFNAFDFNDGYVDVMGIIAGTPAAQDEVLVWAETPVTRPLLNLALTLPAEQRYSYVHVGNAQVIDHMLANDALQAAADLSLTYVHVNTDFSEGWEGDASVPVRSSDHDPALTRIDVPAFSQVDLGVAVSGPRIPVVTGRSGEFIVVLSNDGPEAARAPALSIAVNAAADSVQVGEPAGWQCSIAADGVDASLLTCTGADRWNSGENAELRLQVAPRRAAPQSFLRVRAVIDSRSTDRNAANDAAEASVRVVGRPG